MKFTIYLISLFFGSVLVQAVEWHNMTEKQKKQVANNALPKFIEKGNILAKYGIDPNESVDQMEKHIEECYDEKSGTFDLYRLDNCENVQDVFTKITGLWPENYLIIDNAGNVPYSQLYEVLTILAAQHAKLKGKQMNNHSRNRPSSLAEYLPDKYAENTKKFQKVYGKARIAKLKSKAYQDYIDQVKQWGKLTKKEKEQKAENSMFEYKNKQAILADYGIDPNANVDEMKEHIDNCATTRPRTFYLYNFRGPTALREQFAQISKLSQSRYLDINEQEVAKYVKLYEVLAILAAQQTNLDQEKLEQLADKAEGTYNNVLKILERHPTFPASGYAKSLKRFKEIYIEAKSAEFTLVMMREHIQQVLRWSNLTMEQKEEEAEKALPEYIEKRKTLAKYCVKIKASFDEMKKHVQECYTWNFFGVWNLYCLCEIHVQEKFTEITGITAGTVANYDVQDQSRTKLYKVLVMLAAEDVSNVKHSKTLAERKLYLKKFIDIYIKARDSEHL